MSCVQLFVADIGKMLMDTSTSDVVLVCQEEEIRAHRFVLCARSPVFNTMLQSKMSENATGEVKIDDVDKDVLKEMLRYMYKVEVDETFTKFKELLILADKYEVQGLIKYCGIKIVESLNKDNAFQVGVFAELHNANNLLDKTVEFIMENAPGSLVHDWREQVKESPKMMIKMIDHLMVEDGISGICHEVRRGGVPSNDCNWRNAGAINAIAFEVDSKMQLRGIGLHGDKSMCYNSVTMKVMDEAGHCLFEDRKEFKSNGSPVPIKVLFSKLVTIEANKKYHITADLSETRRRTFNSQSMVDTVHFNQTSPSKVRFFKSPYDNNGGNVDEGQIPCLYFKSIKTTSPQ